MAQLMPLPLTVSCFSKIQIGFAFLVPAHPGSPGQRAVKRVCVCVTISLTAEKTLPAMRLTVEMFLINCHNRTVNRASEIKVIHIHTNVIIRAQTSQKPAEYINTQGKRSNKMNNVKLAKYTIITNYNLKL